jgi:hypothetical protein
MPANCHLTIFLIYVADIILTGDDDIEEIIAVESFLHAKFIIWAISISTFDFEIAVKGNMLKCF